MKETRSSVAFTRWRYCSSLLQPYRRCSHVVNVGGVPMGGGHPVRLQSMTTTDTMDVRATVAQILRLVEAGADYVRVTVPSQREAKALADIKQQLQAHRCQVPLVADVHFTPKAAELAACYVEKVRINPGNYADKKRFEQKTYTPEAYQAELERLEARFMPLVERCKTEGRAMRIGTNHGSLSDRIMSHYGDTPLGMVESALEFVRICANNNYHDLVISMKASQVQIMRHAYRLLVQRLEEETLPPYPLHLGVTEAGDGEDGRMKSAMGIGSLLAEGLGDTIRVSLTEAPERELPIAAALRDTYTLPLPAKEALTHDATEPASVSEIFFPFSFQRRQSQRVLDWGGGQLPRVVCDVSAQPQLAQPQLAQQAAIFADALGYCYQAELDKWETKEQAADYVYTGSWGEALLLPRGLRQVLNYETWCRAKDKGARYPLFEHSERAALQALPAAQPAVLRLSLAETLANDLQLPQREQLILWLQLMPTDGYIRLRRACFRLAATPHPLGFLLPQAPQEEAGAFLLRVAADLGGCFADGYGDGLCLQLAPAELLRARITAFSLLQAARLRLSKTEYIACPSCGRTLFDLEETTARIRSRTSHLKGLKIGIMGCIVNGPGEMADADYGYVGAGKDKITLYRGKEIVQRNIHTNQAVDALIDLIRADGHWQEPPKV